MLRERSATMASSPIELKGKKDWVNITSLDETRGRQITGTTLVSSADARHVGSSCSLAALAQDTSNAEPHSKEITLSIPKLLRIGHDPKRRNCSLADIGQTPA